jgi:hypothetical protein
MTVNIRKLLENFPRETTIGQVLDALGAEEISIREAGIRCSHPNCGRLIFQTGPRRWTHVAPDGTQNRSCKSASFDDPKPGDDDKREWLAWPRIMERQTARPPKDR